MEKIGRRELINSILKRIIIFCIYLIAFILFANKLVQYSGTGFIFPDEVAHISYVAYLEETNEIIPTFEDMRMMNLNRTTLDRKDTTAFRHSATNYLCHPPLYYNIIKVFNLVQVKDGVIAYELEELRQLARMIMYIALIMAFYIGITRIKKVSIHIIYAFTLISIPQFYMAGKVCNDELSFLGVNIFVLGIIRFFEGKRNYLTYILIGLSIFICLLNKVTVSIAVMVACIIIIAYTAIKEKNFKFIFCKQFLVTLPFYIIPFLYYIIIIYRYGTVQPTLLLIDPEFCKRTSFYVDEAARIEYTFLEYTRIFFQKFLSYWGGFKLNESKPLRTLTQAIPTIAILIFPIIDLLLNIKNKSKIQEIPYIGIYVGFFVTLGLQFHKAYYEFQNVTGYLGCNQSRYYVCLMVPFIMMFCNMIEKTCTRIDKMRNRKLVKCMFMILAFAYVIDIYSVNLI